MPRRLLLNLHLYLLLACSGYLILFGVSSLLFNHPIEHEPQTEHWQAQLAVPVEGEPIKQAQSASDQLGLFGWVIPWQTKRAADGALATAISRPGKQYTLRIAPDGHSVSIDEKRQGFLGVLHFLHGGMRVPGSTFVSSWAWYTRFCSLAVLFAAVTGVYLFASSKSSGRRTGWITLTAAGVISLAMILWMVTLA